MVIGSLNYDRIIYVHQIPRGGQTVTSRSSKEGAGGKGANQALAAMRLSRKGSNYEGDIKVSMIGAVGRDDEGVEVQAELGRDGVDVSRIRRTDAPTGRADIVVERDGETRVIFTPGANYSLQADDFTTLKDLGGSNGKPDLLILQLEIPRSVVEKILKIAKQESIDVLLNPAPAKALLTDCWSAVTHLIANETEAAAISGHKLEEIREEAFPRGWKLVADHLLGLGVKSVVITLGKNGAVYSNKIGEGRHIEAEKVEKVLDATTAGDTFVGAYAVSVVRQKGQGLDMKEAVSWASKAAAWVVQRAGTQDTIPWAGDVKNQNRRESWDSDLKTRSF